MEVNVVNKENIYNKLPVFLQNMAIHAEGWKINRRRYDGAYNSLLKSAQERTFWTEPQLHKWQEQKLKDFFSSICKNSYWSDQFLKYGIDLVQDSPFEVLSKLPILNKSEVQKNRLNIINPVPEETISRHTSGTTGGGLVFPETHYSEQLQWAIWWRYRNWNNIDKHTWCTYLGGRSIVPIQQDITPYWRVNKPARQVMYSLYHLSEKTARQYLDDIQRRRLPWIHGYPSYISLLANYVIDSQRIGQFDFVQSITTGAENLLDTQISIIEKAFGVKPKQHYGLAEGVANISMCPEGRLHVDEDFSLVEFDPIEGLEGAHRIIGTNWNNTAFPLLRYDTNDVAILTPNQSCACGRAGRIVARIDGRQEDYLVLPNGVKIGRLDHIFKDMINIKEARIVQNSVTNARVEIVKREGYRDEDEKMLLREFVSRVGGDIHLEFAYLDQLPRTKSGKLKFVESNIK